MLKKYIAFTLAEVLLVTAIIAIVAALTVPNTKKSHDEAAEILRAKKSKLLFMKGEESLKGSSSAVAVALEGSAVSAQASHSGVIRLLCFHCQTPHPLWGCVAPAALQVLLQQSVPDR